MNAQRLADKQTLRALHVLCMQMSVEELQRFCEGQMNAIIVAQDAFKKRFPAEWKVFDDRIENDCSSFAVTEL